MSVKRGGEFMCSEYLPHLELITVLKVKRISSDEVGGGHIAHGDATSLQFSHCLAVLVLAMRDEIRSDF